MKKTLDILKHTGVLFLMLWVGTVYAASVKYKAERQIGGANFMLSATVDCNGTITYTLCGDKKIKNVEVLYNDPSGTGTFDDVVGTTQGNGCNGADDVTWTSSYPTANNNAHIWVRFQYGLNSLGNIASIGLDYSYLGTTLPYSIDFVMNETEPNTNTYYFTYTGDPIDYPYKFNFGEGEITGTELQPGDRIGGDDFEYFFCRGNEHNLSDLTEDVLLTVYESHIMTETENGTEELICEREVLKELRLVDLCGFFDGLLVNNLPPDLLQSEVQASGLTNPFLDSYVESHQITLENPSTVENVTWNQFVEHNYDAPGIYDVTELITLREGCSCKNQIQYNSDNPCYKMSELQVAQSFNNGQYEYTITTSNYNGGQEVEIEGLTIAFGDGYEETSVGSSISHVYDEPGTYTVTQTTIITTEEGEFECTKTLVIQVEEYCCVSFAPIPGQSYWLSGWVKEEHASEQIHYAGSAIAVEFDGTGTTSFRFYPTGDIIEGWQRIVGEFKVPQNASNMDIHLENRGIAQNVFFDDIRVHPLYGSAKTYVYDPITLRLTAELDDNNYATFYEYDSEGKLNLIKKETARGIMTIQESRSSNPKQN